MIGWQCKWRLDPWLWFPILLKPLFFSLPLVTPDLPFFFGGGSNSALQGSASSSCSETCQIKLVCRLFPKSHHSLFRSSQLWCEAVNFNPQKKKEERRSLHPLRTARCCRTAWMAGVTVKVISHRDKHRFPCVAVGAGMCQQRLLCAVRNYYALANRARVVLCACLFSDKMSWAVRLFHRMRLRAFVFCGVHPN